MQTRDHYQPTEDYMFSREPFVLLKDPEKYVADTWQLTPEHPLRGYWIQLFRDHFPSLLSHAREDALVREQDTGRGGV